MPEDPWQDPTAKAYVKHIIDNMVPAMESSACIMQIVPTGDKPEGDVKFWVELGASIMMNKPIISVIFGDADVPPKLALVADRIVRLPEGVTPEASEELARAFKELVADG